MSLSREEMLEIAGGYIAALGIPDGDAWEVLNPDEREWGAIIPFVNRLGRGDFTRQLVGYGPLLVNSSTAEVFLCGSALPAEQWAEEWLAGKHESLKRPPSWRAPEPWYDLRWLWGSETSRNALLAELRREVTEPHDLHGRDVDVVAKCTHCDDIAIDLLDGSFAVVHLTWSRGPEQPPWPRWTAIPNDVDLMASMLKHS